MTTGLKDRADDTVSDTTKGLTETEIPACTTACTNAPETTHGASLEGLAAMLRGLSPVDREQLAQMMAGKEGGSQ